MKIHLLKFAVVICLLLCAAINCMAINVYNWTGNSATTNNWTDKGNWKVSINGAAFVNATNANPYPGSVATDVAQIGVATYSNGYDPVLNASINITSLIFGPNNLIDETINNSGYTLTVSANVSVNYGTFTTNNSDYENINLAGTGTLTCGGLVIGDNSPPAPPTNSAYLYHFLTYWTQVNINGNLTCNSVGNSGNGVNYPEFSIEGGAVKITGALITTATGNPTSGYYNTRSFSSAYPGIGLFANNLGTLEIQNNTFIPTFTPNFYIEFDGNNAGTTTYDAASGNQIVYSAGSSPYILANATYTDLYDYLILSGASTKTVGSGAVVVYYYFNTSGGAITMPATALSTISTSTGYWTNSASVTEGSGLINIKLYLINTGTIIGGTSSTTIGTTLTNSGTITCNAENMTFTGAASNTGAITGGAGTLTFGSTYLNNAAAAAITTGAGTATFTGAYTNTAGSFTAGPGSVYFNNSYTNAATFTAGSGTVFYNLAGAQAIKDNSAGGTNFNNVTFSNSGAKSMSGTGAFSVSSIGTLTMAGTATLATGGILTLKSDATGSAAVAPITTSNPISGNVKAQRYLSADGVNGYYRGYRLISSPVYNSTDANGIKDYSINYLNTSIWLTGTTGTGGGFDQGGNPTLYLYAENFTPAYSTFLNSNFIGISNISGSPTYSLNTNTPNYTSTTIPVGTGYLCFFRGNKAAATVTAETTPSYIPTAATLTNTGTLIQGQVYARDWYSQTTPSAASPTLGNVINGFTLVGNPYPAAIDWESFNTSSTTTGIYGSATVANYVYELNPQSHLFGIYAKGGGSTTNGASRYIASGQGFFVIAGNGAQLIFNESAKSTTVPNATNNLMSSKSDVLALEQSNPAVQQRMRLQMVKDSINTDELIIDFNSAAKTQYVFNEDAPYKIGSGEVSLASRSADNFTLAINRMPLPKTSQTIKLNVGASADGTYHLKMAEIQAIPQLFDIWLMDAYKNDSLDMRHNNTYTFDLSRADTNSYGANRFSIIVRQNPALGLHLLSFAAAKVSAGNQVTWKTENEQNYTHFTVQRSTDGGVTFSIVGGIASTGAGSYSFVDANPITTTEDQYRLMLQDYNGTVTYSNIVIIQYSNNSNNIARNGLNIYPNPAMGTVNLAINQTISTPSYAIQIVNNLGAVVKTATSTSPVWQSDVSKLVPGTYVIRVVNNGNKAEVGKSSFVKL